MEIAFDTNAKSNPEIKNEVAEFLKKIPTLEREHDIPIIVFQDGINNSYYIKCSMSSQIACNLVDIGAKLKPEDPESFRSNRELLTNHNTYLKMKADAERGREFNDIIVEYNLDYNSNRPLKVWGGQHRIYAVIETKEKSNRYHGFRIFFNLNTHQRAEVALISNTNISVSNDTFDRMIEETVFGDVLRKWCQKVGFIKQDEDFPDVGSRSEKITVKLARSFVVNFHLGKERGIRISSGDLDRNVYEPYIVETGVKIDPTYERILNEHDILNDDDFLQSGQKFLALHNAQYQAVKRNPKKISNRKSYRNKAFVESILCAWSYIAGLLQNHKGRLKNHYRIPKTNSKIPDPLNADEMSRFKHNSDPPTYRGLATRISLKERQRMAQVFLAKSLEPNCLLNRQFLNKAVSQVVGLVALGKGYKNV